MFWGIRAGGSTPMSVMLRRREPDSGLKVFWGVHTGSFGVEGCVISIQPVKGLRLRLQKCGSQDGELKAGSLRPWLGLQGLKRPTNFNCLRLVAWRHFCLRTALLLIVFLETMSCTRQRQRRAGGPAPQSRRLRAERAPQPPPQVP